MKRNNSILLLVKTTLNLHSHKRLRILYLVRKISFIVSLWRNLSRRLRPVVEHGFEIYVVHFDWHFPLGLGEHSKVNQRSLLLCEVACPAPCELDTLPFFRGYFFPIKNDKLRHPLQYTKAVVLLPLNWVGHQRKLD